MAENKEEKFHHLGDNLEDYKLTDIKRTVVIPIDGSPHSERAFTWYHNNIYRAGDLVHFVHVIQPSYVGPAYGLGLVISSPSVSVKNISTGLEEAIADGKQLGKRYLQWARDLKVPCKAFLQVDNQPGHAICHFTHEHSGNIIIMGNRGLGKVKRTFLGSCSDHTLHHCHIPVVIVPPEKGCNMAH